MSIRDWFRRLAHGAGYLTLDPSPRLRRLREQMEREAAPTDRSRGT